jgi:hypothetical protein
VHSGAPGWYAFGLDSEIWQLHVRVLAGARKQKGGNKRVLNDFYFLEAKKCNYLSRAAFKLKQIDEKFNVLPKRGSVLDLGCFPGAWMQVACQKLGSRATGGAVVGLLQNVPARYSAPTQHGGCTLAHSLSPQSSNRYHVLHSGIDLKPMTIPQHHCDDRVKVRSQPHRIVCAGSPQSVQCVWRREPEAAE